MCCLLVLVATAPFRRTVRIEAHLGAGEMFKSRCEHRIHTNFTPQTNMPKKRCFVVANFVGHQDGRFRICNLQNMIQSRHLSLD